MDATDDQHDLRLACCLGLFVLHVRGLPGGVQLDGMVLRYDPALPQGERAMLVCREIRRAQERASAEKNRSGSL